MCATSPRRPTSRRTVSTGPVGPRLTSHDAGFSVVELVIALSVLLISLVALLGLANTSSFMVSSSRQRAAMVNAASGYLERVRETPFGSVGTPGGDPVGTLVVETSTSTPYVIAITPTVTWGRPEDTSNHAFKTVTLTVTSMNLGGGSSMTLSAGAVLAIQARSARPYPRRRPPRPQRSSHRPTAACSGDPPYR